MNKFPGMVLTGAGLVSPAGVSKNDLFRYLRQNSVPVPKPGPPVEREPTRLLEHLGITEPKLRIARYLDPVSRNAIVALRSALTDAGIDENRIAEAPFEYGIVFGTTRGACVSRERLYASLVSRHGKSLSGTLFSHCGYNIAGAVAAIAFHIKGPNLTIASAGDLGIAVLCRARQLLISRRVRTVFAGFSECTGARKQTGDTFGEWAYVLCLERKDTAAKRGTAVLAEVRVERVAGDHSRVQNGLVRGLESREALLRGAAETLALPLPGMKAIGDRFASLILLGLLSHDTSLRERFPAVAFARATGTVPTEVRVIYAGRENTQHEL